MNVCIKVNFKMYVLCAQVKLEIREENGNLIDTIQGGKKSG